MQSLFFIIFFLFTLNSYAIIASPESCAPVAFKIENNDIVLTNNSEQRKISQVYFITNKSPQSTFIEHPTANPGASAGWSTFIRPGNWSALVLNKKNFAVHCAMIQPGKVIPLDCSKTITVCRPKSLTTKTPFKGNYWLAEDKNWETFVNVLAKKGVILKSAS